LITDLLTMNAGSHLLRGGRKLKIMGACIPVEWPEIAEDFCQGCVCLSSCPERDHINMISLKIASMLARMELEEVEVLTVDGSPHCLHLHHAIEEVAKIRGDDLKVTHKVVYKGRVLGVSSRAVKYARFLHKVDDLLGTRAGAVR